MPVLVLYHLRYAYVRYVYLHFDYLCYASMRYAYFRCASSGYANRRFYLSALQNQLPFST